MYVGKLPGQFDVQSAAGDDYSITSPSVSILLFSSLAQAVKPSTCLNIDSSRLFRGKIPPPVTKGEVEERIAL